MASKSQRQSRMYEGKKIYKIKLLQIFQSITRVDRYICLQLIFKNFRKLQIYIDVAEVESISSQN